QQLIDQGGYAGLGADQPKRHNFARSFMGDLSRAVVDEQMASGMTPGVTNPRDQYGLYERSIAQAAKKLGIKNVGNLQDVAWIGFKGTEGKPMISHVNDAIERTHRLTGMSRSEIVRRALIKGQIPLYGLGGLYFFSPALTGESDK